jgi:DNA-binding transcriptional MerR regulator
MAESLDIAEARGLVAPLRGASGHRHYGPAELERLQQIMAMKRAGLTLGQIERLSAGRKTDLAGLITAQLRSLDERQSEIDAARGLLTSILSRLDRG